MRVMDCLGASWMVSSALGGLPHSSSKEVVTVFSQSKLAAVLEDLNPAKGRQTDCHESCHGPG